MTPTKTPWLDAFLDRTWAFVDGTPPTTDLPPGLDAALAESLVDLFERADRDELVSTHARLRRACQAATATLEDAPDTLSIPAALTFGRLLGLADLTAVSAGRARPRMLDEIWTTGRNTSKVLLALGEDERTNKALATETGLDPATIARTLRELADQGLVLRRRAGRQVLNSLAPAALAAWRQRRSRHQVAAANLSFTKRGRHDIAQLLAKADPLDSGSPAAFAS